MERASDVKNYFQVEVPINEPNVWSIGINYDIFPNIYTSGSVAVLPSRIMGLTYANYCRMCRDLLGAEIRGKNSMYLLIRFSNKDNAKKLVDVLNKRLSYIIDRMEQNNG